METITILRSEYEVLKKKARKIDESKVMPELKRALKDLEEGRFKEVTKKN